MKQHQLLKYLLPVIILSGCATYHPLALQQSPKIDHVEQLKMDASQHLELPIEWRQHSIHFDDGLNESEIIQLAVLNSPQLVATEATLKEASAQLIQAGLLPDPQLSLSADFPSKNAPGLVASYGLGLGFDLQSLITRSARKGAATKQAQTAYLQVLWQEWQIIQQARILYRRLLIQQQQVTLSKAQLLQTQRHWKVQNSALEQGDATLDTEGLARTSMMNAEAAWFESQRQYNMSKHNLALLLGLSASAEIPLAAPEQGLSSLLAEPPLQPLLQKLILNMHQKRPDLLALQTGYQAQEYRVREQILSQFPSVSVGVNRLRDTGNIFTLGPFVNLNLPLLNANRGNIAIARATRTRLLKEYQDRLKQAEVEASRLLIDQTLAYQELRAIQKQLPDLDQLMQQMGKALANGNVDMLMFTTLQNNYFTQRMKVLVLEQAILEQAVALDTVLGVFIPDTVKKGDEE